MRRHRSSFVYGLSFSALVLVSTQTGFAKPLDADACSRLKQQHDTLEQTGVRAAFADGPPKRVMGSLDERAQRMRDLIDLEAQLRFRCAMDLLIPSLKPEVLVEVPDVVEGEAATRAASDAAGPKAKPVRRAKAMPVEAAKPADTVGATASAASTRKTAEAAPDAKTTHSPAAKSPPKPASKPHPKADDAFHAPAATAPANSGE